jgi:hypothetical protein
MVDTGIYTNPEPYHDLDYAAVCAMQQYNWAQLNNADDKTLSLLRRYINDVKSLLAQRAPVAPDNLPMTPVAPSGPNNGPIQQPGIPPKAA